MSTEKSQQPNAYRQRVEREELRTVTAKTRLASKVETEVANKFIALFGNAKLLNIPEVNLTTVDGPTSSIDLFDGTVTVQARVMHENKIKDVTLPVKVTQSVFDLNDEDIREVVAKAEAINPKQTFAVEEIESVTIEADLGSFELKDDGDDYYKIYHPALDLGRELGIVAKDEYEKIKNKEVLFKETLENQIAGTRFDGDTALNFSGSFVEPKIQKQEKNLGSYKKVSTEEPTQPEADRLMATIGDSYRQSIEAKERAASDHKTKLVDQLVNAVIAQLNSLRYGNVKVASVSDELTYSGSSFTGTVTVTASLFDENGPKDVIVPLEVKDSTFKLLRPEAVKEIVAAGINPRQAIEAEIERETQEKIAQAEDIDEEVEREVAAVLDEPTITKTAADAGGTQYVGQTDVLRLPKHLLNLPEDIEIGTVIYADGFHWKLTSKSESQLSKGENDGSMYVFNKVPAEKESKHKLGI